MVPILLLSTTIFLSLSLLQTHLSHERTLAASAETIAVLEAEVERLRAKERRRKDRESREKERMEKVLMPWVVDRVLQRVGWGSHAAPQEEKEQEVKKHLV